MAHSVFFFHSFLQRDIAKLTQERDSAQLLLSQRQSELQKMSQMLISVEEKSRNGEADEEMQEKYQALIQQNKKLEKQLSTLEKKYQFAKNQLDKK